MSRHDLFLEISQNLEEDEINDLRTYVKSKKLLPARGLPRMDPQEIFVKLEHKLKLPEGDLSLLVDLMKKIGRDEFANEAEKIAAQEREASKKQNKFDRASDSSDDTLAVPPSKRPRFGDKSAKLTTAVDEDKHFDIVIKDVSNKWDHLAKALGFTDNDIKGLRHDQYLHDQDRKCREVLCRWINKHGRRATLQVLCEALIKINEGKTADKLEEGAEPSSTYLGEGSSGGSTAGRPTPRHQERAAEPEAGGDEDLVTDEGDGKIAVKVDKCDDGFWDKIMDEDNPYRMGSKPRGYALVLNNKNFTKLPYRSGAGVDLSNITALLEGLSFEKQVLENKTAKEIEDELRAFSRRKEHRGVDCCVVVLMSHGDEGVIYGTDDNPVQLDDIFTMFDNKNCRSLIDKPKLFFVQACRGTKVDKGVAVPEDQPDSSAPRVDLKREIRSLLHVPEDEADDPGDDAADGSGVTPTRTDMLCGYATQLGYKSFRNTEHGSWFIQAITEVFMKQAKNKSLVQMMTQVTADVSKRTASCPRRPADHGGKEEAEFLSKLHKPLYFFPGD